MTQSAGSETRMTCPKCGLVAGAGVTLCPKDGTKLADYSKDPFVGKIIEQKYEIISPIGEGGMSVVYKAKHLLMDRFVAIKMIRPEYATMSQLIDRFKQETKAVSSLRHPNIVTVFDYGFLPDQTPFLIMDYLEGKVLNQLIKKEKTLNWERAIVLFSQACDALAHSHERGVVHRDIKPSNLLVRQELEGTESLTIFDFGIAKLLNPDGKKLTNVGEVFGSPLYMSPEQCSGDMIDPRTDIYSLACVIYETLVGVPPLVGGKPIETIMKHISDMPRPLREVRPDLNIPPRLEEMVMTALSKAPIDRQPNMITFRNELLSVGNLKLVATGVSVMLDPNEVLKNLPPAQNNSNTPYLQQPGSSNSRLNAVESVNPRSSANNMPGAPTSPTLQPSLQIPSGEYVTDPPHIKENQTIQPPEMVENPFRPVPLPPDVVLSGGHPSYDPNQRITQQNQKKTTIVHKKVPSPTLILSVVAVLVLGAVGGYLVAHPEALQGSTTKDNTNVESTSDDSGLNVVDVGEKTRKQFIKNAKTKNMVSFALSQKSTEEFPIDCHDGTKLLTAIPYPEKIPKGSCRVVVQEVVSSTTRTPIDIVAEPLTMKLFNNDSRVHAEKKDHVGFEPDADANNTNLTLVKVSIDNQPSQYMLYIWNDKRTIVCQFAPDKDMKYPLLETKMREISTDVIKEIGADQ